MCLTTACVWQLYLLLESVKVVNDDSDKQVQDEERAKNDKYNIVEVGVEASLVHWLQVNLD